MERLHLDAFNAAATFGEATKMRLIVKSIAMKLLLLLNAAHPSKMLPASAECGSASIELKF